jgi:hypothetical protein
MVCWCPSPWLKLLLYNYWSVVCLEPMTIIGNTFNLKSNDIVNWGLNVKSRWLRHVSTRTWFVWYRSYTGKIFIFKTCQFFLHLYYISFLFSMLPFFLLCLCLSVTLFHLIRLNLRIKVWPIELIFAKVSIQSQSRSKRRDDFWTTEMQSRSVRIVNSKI